MTSTKGAAITGVTGVMQPSANAKDNVLPPKACLELVSTEGQYCTDLDALVDGFLMPLRDILKREEERAIFSNVETLRGIHSALLDGLRDSSGKTLAGIATAYGKITPFFKAYSQYCADCAEKSGLKPSQLAISSRMRASC